MQIIETCLLCVYVNFHGHLCFYLKRCTDNSRGRGGLIFLSVQFNTFCIFVFHIFYLKPTFIYIISCNALIKGFHQNHSHWRLYLNTHCLSTLQVSEGSLSSPCPAQCEKTMGQNETETEWKWNCVVYLGSEHNSIQNDHRWFLFFALQTNSHGDQLQSPVTVIAHFQKHWTSSTQDLKNKLTQ